MRVHPAIRALFGVAAVAAAAAASARAIAVTAHVSPGGAVTASGAALITKGNFGLLCAFQFNVNLSGSAFTVPPAQAIGTVNAVTVTPGSLVCPVWKGAGTPWTVQATAVYYSGTTFPSSATSLGVTLKGVHFVSTASNVGDCTGDVSGTLDLSTGKITIPAFSIPGNNPAKPCTFRGPNGVTDPIVLTVSPSQSVTVTSAP